MASNNRERDAAQNQHYVPKFILRNFLSNETKEQVSVFRKSSRKGFQTSIRNIMAERRFHEFSIDAEFIASFEESVGRIEDMVLPTYRKVVTERRLEGTAEERTNLALLIAFQFVRTRQQRDMFVQAEQQLKRHLEKYAGSIEQIEGYEPLTPDMLTRQHVEFIRGAIPEFLPHIVCKDLLLLEATEGRSFYLADNPVCLYNSAPADPMFGNIGLAIEGIEIYLPLSSDLMLAAWCPSRLREMQHHRDTAFDEVRRQLLAQVRLGKIRPDMMRIQLQVMEEMGRPAEALLRNVENGTPAAMTAENMDFTNSLQMTYARDYVICKQGDFRLARKFMDDFPCHRGQGISTT